MNNVDRKRLEAIRDYIPPKHRDRGKHDMPLMPQDRVDKLQGELHSLKTKVETLESYISDMNDESSVLYRDNEILKKKVESVEKLPKTWRKYPDSDGWMESCALDVEVALGILRKCPLDGPTIHPRCMNLFDGVCKSPTGLCEQAKKHID